MTKQDIQQFLEARPSISKEGLCSEARITSQYLNMILRGDRRLTDATAKKLEPVMTKYGWRREK